MLQLLQTGMTQTMHTHFVSSKQDSQSLSLEAHNAMVFCRCCNDLALADTIFRSEFGSMFVSCAHGWPHFGATVN